MRILILGGTRFFGKRLAAHLSDLGCFVTLATRGRNPAPSLSGVTWHQAERDDVDSLRTLAHQGQWDCVVDQIGYSPNSAKILLDALGKSTKRIIFTSTAAVYEGSQMHSEEDFDPYHYPLQWGNRDDFDYAEGKRLAEAVYFQRAEVPVCTVRFPYVLGLDDYTKRIEFHLERILKNLPIGIPNQEATFSFVSSAEASRALLACVERPIQGPLNVCSRQPMTARQFVHALEAVCGKSAAIVGTTTPENQSPYFGPTSKWLNSERARQLGLLLDSTESYFSFLVRELHART